jgi:hypothetical protein
MDWITPRNKPIVYEDQESALFLEKSEVDISDIEAKARNEGYREQTERHITIIGGTAQLIRELIAEYPADTQEGLWQKIADLLQDYEWKFMPKDVYHIKKTGTFSGGGDLIEERQSYIRAIEMPDMAKYYAEVSKLLNTDLPVQFPHITLFTKGERENPKWYGIGIASEEVFQTMNPVKIQS